MDSSQWGQGRRAPRHAAARFPAATLLPSSSAAEERSAQETQQRAWGGVERCVGGGETHDPNFGPAAWQLHNRVVLWGIEGWQPKRRLLQGVQVQKTAAPGRLTVTRLPPGQLLSGVPPTQPAPPGSTLPTRLEGHAIECWLPADVDVAG